MLTISVGNNKGGVGKTTIALNLAAVAHLGGARVLIIDADEQKSSIQWMDRRSDASRLAGVVVVGAPAALSLPKFRAMSAGFDVVIIDGPPRVSKVTKHAAAAADVVLVPFRPGALDVWASADTMATLEEANDMREALGLPPSRRVLVINGADPRSKVTTWALDALKDEGEVAPVVIGNRVAFPTATADGEAVATMYPGSAGAREIAALWTCVGGVS